MKQFFFFVVLAICSPSYKSFISELGLDVSFWSYRNVLIAIFILSLPCIKPKELLRNRWFFGLILWTAFVFAHTVAFTHDFALSLSLVITNKVIQGFWTVLFFALLLRSIISEYPIKMIQKCFTAHFFLISCIVGILSMKFLMSPDSFEDIQNISTNRIPLEFFTLLVILFSQLQPRRGKNSSVRASEFIGHFQIIYVAYTCVFFKARSVSLGMIFFLVSLIMSIRSRTGFEMLKSRVFPLTLILVLAVNIFPVHDYLTINNDEEKREVSLARNPIPDEFAWYRDILDKDGDGFVQLKPSSISTHSRMLNILEAVLEFPNNIFGYGLSSEKSKILGHYSTSLFAEQLRLYGIFFLVGLLALAREFREFFSSRILPLCCVPVLLNLVFLSNVMYFSCLPLLLLFHAKKSIRDE